TCASKESSLRRARRAAAQNRSRFAANQGCWGWKREVLPSSQGVSIMPPVGPLPCFMNWRAPPEELPRGSHVNRRPFESRGRVRLLVTSDRMPDRPIQNVFGHRIRLREVHTNRRRRKCPRQAPEGV